MSNEKDPTDVDAWSVDWATKLGADTISTSTWTVPTGITQTTPSPSNTTTTTTIWLSGGTDGVHYTLTNRITTAAGRTLERSFVVQVKNR